MSFLQEQRITNHEGQLSNGLRVVHLQKAHAPISVRTIFRSGARYDTPGKEGLAHFVEHMICTDAQDCPPTLRRAVRIENLGGGFGATTGTELLSINLSVADQADLPVLAGVINEIMNDQLRDEGKFSNERGAILRELGNRLSSPAESLWHDFYPLFFADSQVGRSILGSEATIAGIEPADIRTFFASKLNVERGVIVSVGGVEFAKLVSLLEDHLVLKRSGEARPQIETPMTRQAITQIRHFGTNDQIDFIVGFRVCGFAGNDRYALKIIQLVLGSGFGSSLFRKLRLEHGYIYGGGSSLMLRTETDGAWIFKSACAKKDLQAALDLIAEEFQRVHEGGLLAQEVQFAKNKIIKSLAMDLQTPEALAGFQVPLTMFAPGATIDSYIKGITDCSLEQIALAGKKYFVPGQWKLGLAGNAQEGEFTVHF